MCIHIYIYKYQIQIYMLDNNYINIACAYIHMCIHMVDIRNVWTLPWHCKSKTCAESTSFCEVARTITASSTQWFRVWGLGFQGPAFKGVGFSVSWFRVLGLLFEKLKDSGPVHDVKRLEGVKKCVVVETAGKLRAFALYIYITWYSPASPHFNPPWYM